KRDPGREDESMSVQTEKALAASLKKLLEKKTLEKITVKDITDDCGVNRQTFYYHFHDVYDLVEWILKDEFADLTEHLTADNWQEKMHGVMLRMIEDKSFIMNTYYSLTRRQLDQFLQRFIHPLIEQQIDKTKGGDAILPEDKAFLADMATYSLVGILTEWIASGMKTSYQEQFGKLMFLLDGILEFVVDKFASPAGAY
ncbi:MAG: TetR-like C-terminal domain-containing protein, partial [Eubacterium sp.]